MLNFLYFEAKMQNTIHDHFKNVLSIIATLINYMCTCITYELSSITN